MARLKDATNQAPAPLSATADDRLQFESLVADVSARFVNLPADQVDAEIEAAQRQIVEALGLDRSTLFELESITTRSLYHGWLKNADRVVAHCGIVLKRVGYEIPLENSLYARARAR